MFPMLTDLAKELIDGPNYATVATINADGSIQQSVVWVELKDDAVLFSTLVGRVKEKNLARDPQISLLVIDKDNPYRWATIRGIAEFNFDEADEKIDVLSRKYTGADWSGPREGKRVNIVIRPTRVTQYPAA